MLVFFLSQVIFGITFWYCKYHIGIINTVLLEIMVGIFKVRFLRKAKNISTIITKYISYFSPFPGTIDFQEDKEGRLSC